jgi:hypothetical protein
VDLALPGDAAPDGAVAPDAAEPVKCEPQMRADGYLCEVCVTADGRVRESRCQPPPPLPDANPAMVTGKCLEIPGKDPRCLQCDHAGMMFTTCLRCEMPISTGQGDSCRVCVWSDGLTPRCLQCLAPDGGITHDDCNAVRREVVTR